MILTIAVWAAAGLRPIDETQVAVLDGPLLAGRAIRVDRRWIVAPPGLLRLTTYPRDAVELSLPQADEAMLRAADGTRYGLRGWLTVRVRPEDWRATHAAAPGRGLRGALLAAVRSAADGLDAPARTREIDPARARELESGLAAELDRRGIDLRRLDLDSFDFLAADRRGSNSAIADTRLLVVGLDGADWAILDGLLEAGRMPNLERLIDNGVRAKLLSISPMLSPVIWTSIATGVEPRRHGVLDFLVEDPDGGSRQPVTSVQRAEPTVWEMLSDEGVEVGVVGWWASWPADPVRGYLVSDRLAYQLFGYRADPGDARGKTWPPDLYDEIVADIVSPDSVGWDEVLPYLDGPRRAEAAFDAGERALLDEFRTLLASGRTYLEIADGLRRRRSPRLEIVYFEGTDTIGHLFMPYRPPQLAGTDAAGVASFGQMVDRYYETADDYLGRLLADREGDWTVMIVSDHGFASDATRPRSTDSRIGHGAAADWHRRFGVLVLSGARVRSGADLPEASVYDIAPTILALFGRPVPRSWPGRVLGRALDDTFLETHPVRYRLEDPSRQAGVGAHGLDDPAAQDLLDKLESLGYVSAGGAAEGSQSARNNAGVALLAEGRLEEAETEFRRALAEGGGAPMLKLNLGLTLRLMGRAEEAEPLLREVLEVAGTRRLAANQLARLRLAVGDPQEAARIIRGILEVEPDAAELHGTLGAVLEALGDAESAENEYRTASRLDPDSATARNDLGNLAKLAGRLDEAEAWYVDAIAADPFFMGAYNNLALIYQARGDTDQAVDLYSRALSKAPDHPDVLNNLASLYFATGEMDEARRLWTRLVETEPEEVSPLSNLAGVEIIEGRFSEAELLLRRALTLDAGFGDARINLAHVLAGRGEIDAARAELERATADRRSAPLAWRKLGLLELEQRRPAAAAVALERAAGLTPDDKTLLNRLGRAHLESGDFAAAADAWRRSLAVDPTQEELRRYVERLTGGP